MDSLLLLGIAALVLAGVAVALALRPRGPDPALARLEGVLETLAAQNTAAQARQQEQERAFTAALDERFAAAQARLSESLGSSAKETSKTIAELRERLVKIDEAQKNLAELSTRVVGLQDILANKQARGAFGELQLENLVQSVLPASAYQLQATLSNRMRVDCLIRLPRPPGDICVDAKFPLESYRLLRDAVDGQRAAALKAFAADVSKHVGDIASRYIIEGETAEGALMFLPSEAVYAELHASCGEVVEKANRARVYIVSPTTLWAVLHTMRAVLKDVRMREQAHVIQKEVATLLGDVLRLDDRTRKLQQHFGQVSEDVREIRISAEKIVARGQKIGDVELENGAAAAALAPPKP
ncbi:MAG: DNA recombination protein RmuC [Alphaproteobacteria bacterium]|nr:DNA recombination protein RmuC [Alphaproteobacteria bacterium]